MTARKKGETAARGRIPAFASIEEEAAFWDTHDTTDFEAEFKPARVRFSKNLSQVLAVRLDQGMLEELRRRANTKGIGPTTLARMWILERLQGSAT